MTKTIDIPHGAKFPKASIQLEPGDFIVRTRKRGYLVAFAVSVHRSHAFVQFGDWHTFWLKRF